MTAQHTSDTPEHGTPPEFVELGHAVFDGPPDLDPASSEQWNGLVRARRVITEAENFWKTPWCEGAPPPCKLRTQPTRAPREHAPITVHFNPPGERTGKLVARAWFALDAYFRLRWVRTAIWIGFNVEQLSRLQRIGATSHPLQHVTLIPRERHNYRIDAETIGEDAPHASFVTLLTRDPREIETFAALASQLGHVVNGDRR